MLSECDDGGWKWAFCDECLFSAYRKRKSLSTTKGLIQSAIEWKCGAFIKWRRGKFNLHEQKKIAFQFNFHAVTFRVCLNVYRWVVGLPFIWLLYLHRVLKLNRSREAWWNIEKTQGKTQVWNWNWKIYWGEDKRGFSDDVFICFLLNGFFNKRQNLCPLDAWIDTSYVSLINGNRKTERSKKRK